MDFTITYNDGKGKLTLYCDYFFEKHNGKFVSQNATSMLF